MLAQKTRPAIGGLVRKLGLPDDVIVRDLFQTQLLGAIFARSTSRALAVKGGFAMRMVTPSHRMTKDIDLQGNPKVPTSVVKGIIEAAIADALESGLLDNVTVSAPKQTETVQRWKVNGTLAGGASNIHLTVEVSRRGLLREEEAVSRYEYAGDISGGAPFLVDSFTPQMLAASKTAALASPTREAVRDIYDLDVLIGMKVEPMPGVLESLGYDNIEKALATLWDKLDGMDWERARQDLLPSLPREIRERLDEGEWDAMRLRVGEKVSVWLEAARDGSPRP